MKPERENGLLHDAWTLQDSLPLLPLVNLTRIHKM